MFLLQATHEYQAFATYAVFKFGFTSLVKYACDTLGLPRETMHKVNEKWINGLEEKANATPFGKKWKLETLQSGTSGLYHIHFVPK